MDSKHDMSARYRFQLGISENLPGSGLLDISMLLSADPARIHSLVERTGSARIEKQIVIMVMVDPLGFALFQK